VGVYFILVIKKRMKAEYLKKSFYARDFLVYIVTSLFIVGFLQSGFATLQ
jgi:hypothetical protein